MGMPLGRLLVRRVVAAIGVLWVVSILLFSATHVLPGDPAARILGNRATPETLAELRSRMGLDRPYLVQYADWITDFVTGEVTSLATGRSVWPALRTRAGNSLLLGATALVLAIGLGFAVGLASGMQAGHPTDHTLTVGALIGLSVPDFVIAALCIGIFALALDILPPVSVLPAGTTPFDRPGILVLPAVSLALPTGAWISRFVRAAVVDARLAPNVEAARLAGLSPARVNFRHLLPGVMGSVAQAMAAASLFLIGGSVVVEQLFAFPGLGSMLTTAVRVKDVSTVLAVGLVTAAAAIAAFSLADIVGLLANPRLRRTR